MKKFLCSFFAIFLCIAIYSQTPVPPGPISGTWTLAGSPYLIEGVNTIEDGTTLTIEPKVEVIWQNDSCPMWVFGQILAMGTESDSIKFLAANPLEGWGSIRFYSTPASNDTSRFEYCLFEYGKVFGDIPDNSGGAIAIFEFSKVTIDHCSFIGNEATDISIYTMPIGGAIALRNASPIINNCLFYNNKCYAGGAIGCYLNSNPEIKNNVFTENDAIGDNYAQGYGGAICCYVLCSPTIKNNTFTGNWARNGGGAIGMVSRCDPTIDHNLIYDNTSVWLGGGIEIQDTCSPIIVNNTIAYNTADYGGGIDCWDSTKAIVRNTILWGNTAPNGNQVYLKDLDSQPDFFYCDIEGSDTAFGGVPHTGEYKNCIDADPLFVDHLTGDYHLMSGSSCIDAGDPASPPDPDGTISDMGALFFDQTGIGISEISTQYAVGSMQVWPNPTYGKSDIRYQISEVRSVLLTVYDITGKQVMLLADEMQNAGEHVINIDISELPDGLYVIRLQAGKESAVGKVLVVR